MVGLAGANIAPVADNTAKINKEVPLWEKTTLTIREAAALSGIGQNKIREMISDPECDFVLSIGSKNVVKRELFVKHILGSRYI